MNETLSTIELIGAVPGIFFAFITLFRKNSSVPNRILGFGLFFYSLILLIIYLGRIQILPYSQTLFLLSNTAVSLSWPLFFLYIGMITAEIESLDRRHLLHLLPALFYILIFVVPLAFFPLSNTMFILSSIYSFLISISYTFHMIMFLRNFIIRSNEYYAENDAERIVWLRTTIIIWLVIIFIQLVFMPFRQTLILSFPFISWVHALILNIASISWIYAFAYFSFTHPDIFNQSRKVVQTLKQVENDKKKEPVASDNFDKLIEKRLSEVISEKKPYLNEMLTLPELAEMINVPPYILSRYINLKIGRNFITYINELRIESVKKILLDTNTKNITILEAAYKSGFKTKSAFNNFFKKSTGLTPTEFRRKNQL